MQKIVIPPRRWVPVDVWLTANRAQRDAELAAPASFEEVERVDKRRRAAARRAASAS